MIHMKCWEYSEWAFHKWQLLLLIRLSDAFESPSSLWSVEQPVSRIAADWFNDLLCAELSQHVQQSALTICRPWSLMIIDSIALCIVYGFPGCSVVKSPPANAGDRRDVGLIPGWGRSPGGGNGNSLQYSCLENLMDKGDWCATVHGVAKCQTLLHD